MTTTDQVYFHVKVKNGFKVYKPKYHKMAAGVLARVNKVVAIVRATEVEQQATEFLLALQIPTIAPTKACTTLKQAADAARRRWK